MVTGIISGRDYTENDIFDPRLYPRMKEEPLLNSDDCLVVPVRNENAPHFRRIGNPSFGTRLGRDENNPTHDECVKYIFDELNDDKIKDIQFSTYVFNDKKQHEEQVIFKPINSKNYSWFMEKDCRTAFSDDTYIKPDLAGRDATKFSPTSAYPNVILEIIRTHIPNQETFKKLFELSKCNYHIYFYFIAEGNNTSKINNLRNKGNTLSIRTSHYLIGGKLFKNGREYYAKGLNESFEHWYNYLRNSYFKYAIENA